MKFPSSLIKLAKTLFENNKKAYLVGGAVRNIALGLEPKDFDIATDANPEEIQRFFRRTIPTGIEHGTVTVLLGQDSYEVTTFRTESNYSDGRHPDSVAFSDDLLEDLSRRDFTINSMAIEILTRNFIDPFNGKGDLKNRCIKAIGNPTERFKEDALRMFRAIRFSSQLDFDIDSTTLNAIQPLAHTSNKLSKERIRDEFTKILLSQRVAEGLELLRETGLLERFVPELTTCCGVTQGPTHAFDVYYHSIYSCEGAPPEIVGRLAALLHDIGKAVAKTENNDGTFHFHRHEIISGELSEEILRRLKYPNKTIETVSHLIKNHMFNYNDNWSDGAVRRFIYRVGIQHLVQTIQLRQADRYGMQRLITPSKSLIHLEDRIQKILGNDNALSIKDLAINGNDLMKELHIPPGPAVGQVLSFLLDSVLEDPEMNTKQTLLTIGKNFYLEYLV